jgi:cystathionine gamma-synthase
VLHATTKYIGGHGDALGGVVLSRESTDLIREVRQVQLHEGAVPSAFECWLIRRGIDTLPCRMRQRTVDARERLI